MPKHCSPSSPVGRERAPRSLATLCDVIEALAANSRATTHGGAALQKRHVPYRNSTLTWLLKDGLGQGRKRVIQRRFNVGVLEAIPKRKASTL